MVVFLDDEKLREGSDCYSSAWVNDGKDHSIEAPHYFLVLQHDEKDDLWLLAPLSSRPGPNRERLLGAKGGFIDQWHREDTYFFKFQFWKAPTTAIVRASYEDVSPMNERRTYGSDDGADLKVILDWHERNRNDFHVVGPKT